MIHDKLQEMFSTKWEIISKIIDSFEINKNKKERENENKMKKSSELLINVPRLQNRLCLCEHINFRRMTDVVVGCAE